MHSLFGCGEPPVFSSGEFPCKEAQGVLQNAFFLQFFATPCPSLGQKSVKVYIRGNSSFDVAGPSQAELHIIARSCCSVHLVTRHSRPQTTPYAYIKSLIIARPDLHGLFYLFHYIKMISRDVIVFRAGKGGNIFRNGIFSSEETFSTVFYTYFYCTYKVCIIFAVEFNCLL